jgi:hypothetical protein
VSKQQLGAPKEKEAARRIPAVFRRGSSKAYPDAPDAAPAAALVPARPPAPEAPDETRV